MPEIQIPYNFEPRDYQIPILKALDNGYKRAIMVAHRRSGKDKTLINLTVKKMFERVGIYYYIFPTYQQARKVIWEGIDRGGMKFLDHFPSQLIKNKNDTELKIEATNGSLFRLIGSDNIDSIMGTNPIGCVFSEYSLQDPIAWDFMRPILAENGGWAVFNYTPRGENHGWQLLEMARKNPKHWFVCILTVEDTGAVPKEVLEQERQEIIEKDGNDALYQQEYMCSFKVPIGGAYYAKQIMDATKQGRICELPYDKTKLVDTWWDIGVGDATAIWFTQDVGEYVHVIDYEEANGKGLPYFVKVLQDKGYIYGSHNAPFDIGNKEWGTGETRIETALSLGIKFNQVRKIPIQDGIEAVRNFFPKVKINETACQKGLNALKCYHKEEVESKGVAGAKFYKDTPTHDWSSHGADSFRYLAVGYRTIKSMLVEDNWSDETKPRTHYRRR